MQCNARIRFAIASAPAWLLMAGIALAAAAAVEGKYQANGKDATLSYAIAVPSDPFMNLPVIQLVLSEKNPAGVKMPEFAAQGGHLGDALAVKLQKDKDGKWDTIGAEFAHAALKHSGTSSSGVVEVDGVTEANGEIAGHLYTRPKADLFDEPIAIDLHFRVKAPAKK